MCSGALDVFSENFNGCIVFFNPSRIAKTLQIL